ncbi:hypothetical protein vseg_018187 [Gypsophila vaccaria]
MSSKRSRPYDEPPSPESSAEEEEEEEEVEEEEEEDEDAVQQTPIQTLPKQPLESDDVEDEEEEEDEVDEEESDDDDEDVKNPALTPKTPVETKTKVVPEPKSESDSETDSDADVRPSQKASNYTIKPVIKDSPMSKPKSALPKAVPVKEKEKEKEKKGVKVQQKGLDDDEDGAEKKGAITRLWGFNDEIAVLQGLIDFKRENNKDPGSNHDDFYNFVKDKLSNSKFTKLQIMDKVRRLKKKYRNHLTKSGGKDPEIVNPHELKSFQLCKLFWGDVDGGNIGNANSNSIGGSKSNSKAHVSDNAAANLVTISSYNNNSSNHVKSSAKKIKLSEKVIHSEGDMMEVDEENKRSVSKDSSKEVGKDFGQLYPHLVKAFEGESVPRVPLLDGFKSFLTHVDSSQLEEWDRKWKDVRLAETAAYISRLALIQEQMSWFCNAMKSSKR